MHWHLKSIWAICKDANWSSSSLNHWILNLSLQSWHDQWGCYHQHQWEACSHHTPSEWSCPERSRVVSGGATKGRGCYTKHHSWRNQLNRTLSHCLSRKYQWTLPPFSTFIITTHAVTDAFLRRSNRDVYCDRVGLTSPWTSHSPGYTQIWSALVGVV